MKQYPLVYCNIDVNGHTKGSAKARQRFNPGCDRECWINDNTQDTSFIGFQDESRIVDFYLGFDLGFNVRVVSYLPSASSGKNKTNA